MYISKVLEEILVINKIPIIATTDKKSLYEVSKTLTTTEKLLRVDTASISCVKGQIRSKKVKLKWVEGKDHVNDCHTKNGASSLHLLNVLKPGVLE